MLGQLINVTSYNLADEGGSMRKKRLFAISLMIVLSALFITLQINPARIASTQEAKVKQDGFIAGCSETVIDALDECIQERFSKVETIFGITRVGTIATKGHKQLFQCSFISPLDRYIQDRFTQRGRGFGIERIMMPGRGLHTPISSRYSHSKTIAYTESAKSNNIKKP